MTHPDDDAEKAARIAARDMAWEIKGDMGLPEEDYDELIEAFLQGQRHERERSKWVSVEERLPERGAKQYLVFDEGNIYKACWDVGGDGRWRTAQCDYGCVPEIVEPTHWQPLPAPPKEGQE